MLATTRIFFLVEYYIFYLYKINQFNVKLLNNTLSLENDKKCSNFVQVIPFGIHDDAAIKKKSEQHESLLK